MTPQDEFPRSIEDLRTALRQARDEAAESKRPLQVARQQTVELSATVAEQRESKRTVKCPP